MSNIQAEVEASLREAEPEVEVLLAEVVGRGTARLFIDHPDGVSHALCQRVTAHLAPLRANYTLEVSSPGRERPLTKPDHFRRFLGRRARIRIRGARGGAGEGPPRRSYTGELVGATDRDVTMAAPDGVVSIPYVDIQRSNLLED